MLPLSVLCRIARPGQMEIVMISELFRHSLILFFGILRNGGIISAFSGNIANQSMDYDFKAGRNWHGDAPFLTPSIGPCSSPLSIHILTPHCIHISWLKDLPHLGSVAPSVSFQD
jgi:hypothetical protein